MEQPRYSLTAQALHWSVALAVLAAYSLALWRDEMPKGDFRNTITGLHMSLGILVLGLSAFRIGLRAFSTSLPQTIAPEWMKLAAKIGHAVLYLSLLAIPLIGILMVWAKGRPVMFFGTSLVAPFTISGALAEPLEELHEIAANIMMIMAGLHAAAAIIHQYVLRDGTLSRMLPNFSRRA